MKAGWDWRPLGEVCKTASGATPAKTNKAYYEGGQVPWLLSGEIAQGEITKANNFITELGLKNSSAKLFPQNSVLIAMYGATAGQVGILRFEAATNQAVCAILPNPQLLPKFLFYVFLYLKESLVAKATGNAQPNISQIKIKNTLIPVLPFEDQRRIVAVLDEAFAAIATATANAEKNLANARDLLTAAARQIFDQPSCDWNVSPLGALCEIYQPQTIGRKDMVDDGPYVVFGANGMIGRYDQYNHEEPQLLVTCRGATCGSINMSEPFSWITGNAMVVRPRDNSIRVGFLRAIFQHVFDFSKVITGAAQPQITRQSFAPAKVVFPTSLEEQAAIEAKLYALDEEVNGLAENYRRQLASLADLKQSLLRRAFTGELTATAPDLMPG